MGLLRALGMGGLITVCLWGVSACGVTPSETSGSTQASTSTTVQASANSTGSTANAAAGQTVVSQTGGGTAASVGTSANSAVKSGSLGHRSGVNASQQTQMQAVVNQLEKAVNQLH
jgi:hypothetical protein